MRLPKIMIFEHEVPGCEIQNILMYLYTKESYAFEPVAFFAWLFLLMVIPFPARKVIWLAGSRQIMGKAYFTGHHFDPLGGIASHLVVIFYLGRDSIVFN